MPIIGVFSVFAIYALIPLTATGGFYWNKYTNFNDLKNYSGSSVQITGQSLRVLVLTDHHYIGLPFGVDGRTDRAIKQAVAKTQPELILVLGDNVATPMNHWAQRRFIQAMDRFGVPWAPLFGNHDGLGRADSNYLSRMIERESVYSIFRWGPNNIGVPGNYFVNITNQADEIVHSFILMSSKHSPWFVPVYPPLTIEQVEWYEWVIHGLNNWAGRVVPTTLALHVPLPVFETSWYLALENGKVLYGDKREPVMHSGTDKGLFERIVTLGSTRSIIAGHDHTNDFVVSYQNIIMSHVIAGNKNVGMLGAYGDYNGGMVIDVFPNGSTIQTAFRLYNNTIVHGLPIMIS